MRHLGIDLKHQIMRRKGQEFERSAAQWPDQLVFLSRPQRIIYKFLHPEEQESVKIIDADNSGPAMQEEAVLLLAVNGRKAQAPQRVLHDRKVAAGE